MIYGLRILYNLFRKIAMGKTHSALTRVNSEQMLYHLGRFRFRCFIFRKHVFS